MVTVDRRGLYYGENVNYQIIPKEKVTELSTLLFEERDDMKLEKFYIFKSLTKLSTYTRSIEAIDMSESTTDNCVVSSLETALKVILSNCRESIFSLELEIDDYSLRWNRKQFRSTLEMKKRFHGAVKGENTEWDQQLDYLFDYYLHRNGELPEDNKRPPNKSEKWYRAIRNMFAMDYYVQEMRENNGKLLTNHRPHPESIPLIEPKGRLYEKAIQDVLILDLDDELDWIEEKNEDLMNVYCS